MIYGFIVKMVVDLNLLDFFARFQDYAEYNGLEIYDSFQFTRWLMDDERVAVQDVSIVTNVDTIRKFWKFQDEVLNRTDVQQLEKQT